MGPLKEIKRPLGLNTWALETFDWSEDLKFRETLQSCKQERLQYIERSTVYGDTGQNRWDPFFGDHSTEGNQFVCGITGMKKKQGGTLETNHKPGFLETRVDELVKSLPVDHLDLLCIHTPSIPEEPDKLYEIARKLKQKGRTRYVGLSFSDPDVFEDEESFQRWDVLRIPYNLVDFARHSPGCLDEVPHDLIVYDPLSGGVLTNHYANTREEISDREVREHHPKFSEDRFQYLRCIHRLAEYLKKEGRENMQLETMAVSWLLERVSADVVSLSFRNPEQVLGIFSALEHGLVDREINEIESIVEETLSDVSRLQFINPPPVLPRHTLERHILRADPRGERSSSQLQGMEI
ncbi:MAG: aldo/keto reductase [bacterium]